MTPVRDLQGLEGLRSEKDRLDIGVIQTRVRGIQCPDGRISVREDIH